MMVSLDGEVALLTCWLALEEGDLRLAVSSAEHARARFKGDLSRNSHQLAPLYLARALTALGRLDDAEAVLAPLRTETFALGAVSEGTRAEARGRPGVGTGANPRLPLLGCPPLAVGLDVHRCRAVGPPAGVGAVAGRVRSRHHRRWRYAPWPRWQPSIGDPSIVTDEVLTLLALSEVQVRSGQYRAALGSDLGGQGDRRAAQPGRWVAAARGSCRSTYSPSAQAMPCAPSVCCAGCRARPTSCSCGFGSACFAGRVVAAQMLREVEPATPRQEAEHALLSAWSQLGRSRRAQRAAPARTGRGLRGERPDDEPGRGAARRARRGPQGSGSLRRRRPAGPGRRRRAEPEALGRRCDRRPRRRLRP